MAVLSKSIPSWGVLLTTILSLAQVTRGKSPEQITLGDLPQNDPSRAASRKPNIVLILTDDQDLHMNSMDYLPHINKHLVDQGTFFKRHFCTTAICCPSRATLLTGKAAHNTNVTDVSPPHGRLRRSSPPLKPPEWLSLKRYTR